MNYTEIRDQTYEAGPFAAILTDEEAYQSYLSTITQAFAEDPLRQGHDILKIFDTYNGKKPNIEKVSHRLIIRNPMINLRLVKNVLNKNKVNRLDKIYYNGSFDEDFKDFLGIGVLTTTLTIPILMEFLERK